MGKWLLVILIITPGVWSGDLGVTLKNQCALQGTSVVFKCKYDYPFGHIVTSVSWSKVQLVSGKMALIPVSELHSSPYHFTYLGNHRGNCDLKVNNVQLSDEGQYYFGFYTTLSSRRTEKIAFLHVRGLTAEVHPNTVTEGDTVRLTCRSGCPESKETIWFKDGKYVSRQIFQANREDAGRYYCAVLGQEGVQSAPVVLTVNYAPRNVMLSLSPSGDIVKGSTVIFTCSSDAQPPVAQSGYSLYKDGKFISSGSRHIIPSIQISQSGLYHCLARNSNGNPSNSSALHLDVLYPPMNVSVSINQKHIIVGSSVNLTCSSDANPAAENYTWFKRTESPISSSLVQVDSGQVLFLPSMEQSHAGLYLCHVSNKLGGNNSTEMMLAMTREQPDFLAVLAVVGVSLLLMLGIALLFFWKKQKYTADKKASQLSRRTSNAEDPPESLYSNISPSPFSPPTSVQTPASFEDGCIYTMVTIKPREQIPRNNKKSRRWPQESWFKEQENDSSVIYSTLAKPS